MKKLTIISIIIIVLGGVGYYLYLTDSLNLNFLKNNQTVPITENQNTSNEVIKEDQKAKTTEDPSAKLVRMKIGECVEKEEGDWSCPSEYDITNLYKDIVTKDGWKIEFLVNNKDIKTKYDSLYIQWSKGSKVGTYEYNDQTWKHGLSFKGESVTHLFLEHQDTSHSNGLIIAPKETSQKVLDLTYTMSFDTEINKVSYWNIDSKEDLEIVIIDLNTNKQKSVIFKNECVFNSAWLCIDSIIFDKNYVKISANFPENSDGSGKEINEEQIVKFE